MKLFQLNDQSYESAGLVRVTNESDNFDAYEVIKEAWQAFYNEHEGSVLIEGKSISLPDFEEDGFDSDDVDIFTEWFNENFDCQIEREYYEEINS